MDNARGKFDMIFTNPPFGANVEVASSIAAKYSLTSIAGSSPEVLFLEACYKFLKPGGKMAIVVPDSILGNPSMEDLRKWILQNFKLLASVDLPVETFKPQVGVQASLLFLQKKTAMERLKPLEKEDYDVFMAIAEKVGKDLRGVPIYKRDEDGAEMLFEHEHRWLSYEPNGSEKICSRHERIKHLDDDLPEIAKAYRTFLNDLKQTDL
jgi:type I restriction enzyme M protein